MNDPRDPGKFCYKCNEWEHTLVRTGWDRYGFGRYQCEYCIPNASLRKYYQNSNTGHYSERNDIRQPKSVSISSDYRACEPFITQYGKTFSVDEDYFHEDDNHIDDLIDLL